MAKLIDITGKAISGEWGNDDETGQGIPVLRTTNFTNAGVINFSNVVTRDIKKVTISNKFLRKGDIIIEKSGGSDKQPVGRVVYFEAEENKYLFNNFTGLLRILDNSVCYSKYLFYALFSNYQRGGTIPYQNKTTGLHNLKTDDYVKKCDIPLPSLEEQKRIASNLDKVTHTIDLCNQIIEKLDLLVKAKFVEMFGDFKNNSKCWNVVRFADIAVIDSNMTTNFEKYANYPHIGIDSIEKNTGELKEYRTVSEDNLVSGKYIFSSKHIIYSKIRPNLNKVALPNFEGLCSADAYPILPIEGKCNRIFLAYNMRSDFFLDYILQYCSRTNLPKVNKKEVSNFITPLPPIELQEQFADFVEQTEKSKSAVKQVLEKAEMLKKSLMQEYFG